MQQFYSEYSNFCETTLINPRCRAGKETFRKVLLSLESSIRLIGCKGSFQTCDICNNANDMLRASRSRYSREQREIILKFKRLHLLQQAQERRYQEQNRLDAAAVNYQPTKTYILSDGMTAMRGDTPKVGGGNFRASKRDTQCIANRVIGNNLIINTSLLYIIFL
jgi:hypothetical protein